MTWDMHGRLLKDINHLYQVINAAKILAFFPSQKLGEKLGEKLGDDSSLELKSKCIEMELLHTRISSNCAVSLVDDEISFLRRLNSG